MMWGGEAGFQGRGRHLHGSGCSVHWESCKSSGLFGGGCREGFLVEECF